MDLIIVAARAIVIYLFIIVAIRVFGKRELTQLSVLDLVFILLISNSVQNAMVGNNTSVLGGIAAATGLFILNFLLGNLFTKSKKISEFFQGDPLMLIYKGQVIGPHLQRSGITMDELEAAVREHGVDKISDVDLSILETDGSISVLSHNFTKRTSRKRRAHKIISKND